MDKLIVEVALTGGLWHKADNPSLPVTPEEVARDVRACADAGASVFHVHARSRWDNYSCRASRFQGFLDAVRTAEPGAIVSVSCSGRTHREVSDRAEVLALDGIDLATLTCGSFNYPTGGASINDAATIRALAGIMRERKIAPELECFEPGHVAYALRLIEKGKVAPPFTFGLFLGVSCLADRRVLDVMLDWLPEGAIWFGAGGGKAQQLMHRWAVALGGHVRTGLEDSLRLDGELTSNPALAERAVAIGRALGREPASIEGAREIIWGKQ